MDNSTNEAHRLQPGDDKQPLITKTETGCDPVKRLVRTDDKHTSDRYLYIISGNTTDCEGDFLCVLVAENDEQAEQIYFQRHIPDNEFREDIFLKDPSELKGLAEKHFPYDLCKNDSYSGIIKKVPLNDLSQIDAGIIADNGVPRIIDLFQ